jgi:tetratricopeptide (TPR) repeat protein
MKKIILLHVILTVFITGSSRLIAENRYTGEPRTIAHDFIELEKNFGSSAADLAAINDLINKASGRISFRKNSSTEDAVNTLLQIDALLKEEGFVYKQNYLLSTGIREKTIDCDNYCALYIAIAEVIKIPLVPVYAPGHSFIRFYFDDGSYLNWEPIKAVPQPDAWYIKHLNISAESIKKGVYLKTLTRKEFLAVEYNSIGSHLLINRRYGDAAVYYTAAIKLYPSFSAAYHNRGTAYYAMGRSKEALADLLIANGLDPMSYTTHNTLGDIYLDSGELEKAEAEFRTAISLDPSYFVPYQNMAYVKKAQGKHKEADLWQKRAQAIKAKYGIKRRSRD